MSGDLILGVDGGGSKVLVALADRSGKILRSALGGGVNPMDNPDWRRELEKTIAPFRQQANLVAVTAALPAYGEVAELSRHQEEAISQQFPAIETTVLNDVDAAHLGAFAGKPGILILSGTGSMAWARDEDGNPSRSGGWGDVIGDEGSSYWIGRLALNLVSQSIDGRCPPTGLTDILFDHLQIDRADAMNGLAGWVSTLKRPRAGIAALSRLVDLAAQNNDRASQDLLEQAAEELAKLHRSIGPLCGNQAEWTYAGGTFASAFLLAAVERRIGKAATAPKLPPIGGPLLAAAQSLGWVLDDAWVGHTAASARAATTQTINSMRQ